METHLRQCTKILREEEEERMAEKRHDRHRASLLPVAEICFSCHESGIYIRELKKRLCRRLLKWSCALRGRQGKKHHRKTLFAEWQFFFVFFHEWQLLC